MAIKRRPPNIHLTQTQLSEMFTSLAGDSRFQVLFDQFYEARENAIQDLCNDAVVGNIEKVAAAIGEIRTYNAILSYAVPTVKADTFD